MRFRRSSTNVLGAALAYAMRGIPVLPCHYPVGGEPEPQVGHWTTYTCSCQQLTCLHPAEHPMTPRGVEDATTDPNQIAAWWDQYPQANVGLVTGVAFDVLDLAEGALPVLDPAHRALLTGPLARTGGGRLLHFVAPTGLSDVVALTGLGVRPGTTARAHWHGAGGYVLAPPSRHASGVPARWLRSLDTPLPRVAPPLTAVPSTLQAGELADARAAGAAPGAVIRLTRRQEAARGSRPQRRGQKRRDAHRLGNR